MNNYLKIITPTLLFLTYLILPIFLPQGLPMIIFLWSIVALTIVLYCLITSDFRTK